MIWIYLIWSFFHISETKYLFSVVCFFPKIWPKIKLRFWFWINNLSPSIAKWKIDLISKPWSEVIFYVSLFRKLNKNSGLMFWFARRVVSLSSSREWKTKFSSQVCSKRLVWPPFWPTAQVPTLCSECTPWSGPGGSSQCPFPSSFSFMMKPENSSSAETLAAGLKTRPIIKFSKILWYH